MYVYGLVQRGASFVFQRARYPVGLWDCFLQDEGRFGFSSNTRISFVYCTSVYTYCTFIIYTVQRMFSGDERQYYVASCSDLNGRLGWK